MKETMFLFSLMLQVTASVILLWSHWYTEKKWPVITAISLQCIGGFTGLAPLCLLKKWASNGNGFQWNRNPILNIYRLLVSFILLFIYVGICRVYHLWCRVFLLINLLIKFVITSCIFLLVQKFTSYIRPLINPE